MIEKNNPALFKSLLLFLVTGSIWIFVIRHFLFPYDQEHIDNSLFHFIHVHFYDFLFLLFTTLLLYLFLNRSYKRLQQINRTLEDREQTILIHQQQIETLYEKERYLRSILSVIRDVNASMITAVDVDALGRKCCDRIARHSNYQLVWIGMIEESRIIVKYYSTDLTGFLDFTSLPLPDERGQSNCPICWAIEEDQTIIINDVNDPTLPEKLRNAVEQGIYSLISLPLKAHEGQKHLEP